MIRVGATMASVWGDISVTPMMRPSWTIRSMHPMDVLSVGRAFRMDTVSRRYGLGLQGVAVEA